VLGAAIGGLRGGGFVVCCAYGIERVCAVCAHLLAARAFDGVDPSTTSALSDYPCDVFSDELPIRDLCLYRKMCGVVVGAYKDAGCVKVESMD
jgi:hypothetical protein